MLFNKKHYNICQKEDCRQIFKYHIKRKFCLNCNPFYGRQDKLNRISKQKISGLKLCGGTCKQYKTLDCFFSSNQQSDGKYPSCKECFNEYKRSRIKSLTCNNPDCGKRFKHNRRRDKCFDCKPLGNPAQKQLRISSYQKEQCKKCIKCKKSKKLLEYYRRLNDLTAQCKLCLANNSKNRSITQICENPKCASPKFENRNRRKYCEICRLKPISRSKTFCLKKSKKYSSRSEFFREDHTTYEFARKNKWLEEICEHMGDPCKGGHRFSDFNRACLKNKGNALLYLLKCYNDNEIFYKCGITSSTVKRRYEGKKRMPYEYTILWSLEGPPKEIWDLEVQFQRKTKEYNYKPLIYFGGNTECVDHKIPKKFLRKPKDL